MLVILTIRGGVILYPLFIEVMFHQLFQQVLRVKTSFFLLVTDNYFLVETFYLLPYQLTIFAKV